MAEIVFTTDFLARLLMTDPEKISFCILSRIYDNPEWGVFHEAAVRVQGIEEARFSLGEGSFVRLGERGDSRIEAEEASVEPCEKGWRFTAASGLMLEKSEHELLRFAYDRVVNPQLK